MYAYLFNRAMTERFLLDVISYDMDEYKHTFGGVVSYQGIVPPNSELPAALLFRFDLRDPSVGVKIPRVRWLPIFYPFGNLGGAFIYRVISNRAIEILSNPYPKSMYRRGVKRDAFPTDLPKQHVELLPTGYDPRDPEDVDYCGAVLGIDGLTPRERTTLLRKMNQMYVKRYDDVYEPERHHCKSLDDLVPECCPFTQGMYNSPCPRKDCVNHRKEGGMRALLCIDPEEDDEFYELIGAGDDGQLVFEICPKCHTLMAHNPAT
jgi:hypothetical protein